MVLTEGQLKPDASFVTERKRDDQQKEKRTFTKWLPPPNICGGKKGMLAHARER